MVCYLHRTNWGTLMRRALAPLAIVGLLLTGCSAGEQEPTDETTGVAVGNDVVQESQTEASTPQPGFDKPVKFGQTVTFPNGVEVTLDALPLKPNNQEETMVETNDLVAEFALTVKNGSEQRLEGDVYSGAFGMPGLSHPGQEENAINDAPSIGALFPGDEETSTFSYFVTGPAEVQLEIPAPGDSVPAVFEGKLTK